MARLDPEEIGLHTIRPKPGSRQARKRLGRGKGSGTGKTAGRGHKGAGARSGNKSKRGYEGGQNPIHMRMRKLRGPQMKKSMPFERFRTHTQPVNVADLEARFDAGAEVTPRDPARGRVGQAQPPGQGARPGRDLEEADGPRARVQRQRAARRSRRAGGEPRKSIERLMRAPDDRERLRGPGDPAEDRLHTGDAAALPARRLHPCAGSRHRHGRVDRGQLHRQQRPRLPQPVLGRKPPAPVAVRAGNHALHHRLDHPAVADGGRAGARAAAEGGRGRPAEDHAVHALSDRRARVRPVARLRLPVPELPERRGHERRRRPDLRQGVPDRDLADRGHARC